MAFSTQLSSRPTTSINTEDYTDTTGHGGTPSRLKAAAPDSIDDPNDSFNMQATLLLAAIESFTVGLIIVAQDGTILHKNSRANSLLEGLSSSPSGQIPQQLWRTCNSLLEHHDEQPEFWSADQHLVLEDEIFTAQGTIFVRAQWFDWEYDSYGANNCFLITLENREQSLVAIAKQEAQRYGLTNRESEVWCLKRMDQSYKEIAKALFISENTVKKHLKNIYAKKEQSTWLN